MNKQEAMELLSAFHSAPEAEMDAKMLEALELAESDPDLQQWLQRQAEMDSRLKEILESTPVPDGLEASLLETVGVKPAQRKPSFNRSRFMGWGIAAAVILGIGSVFVLRQNEDFVQDIQATISGTTPDDFSQFRDGMAFYIRSVYFQLDHLTEDLDSIESWLEEEKAPVYDVLPEGLTALVPLGCKELSWQGHDVSLVCFHTADGKIVHMFILNQEGVDSSSFRDITSVATSHKLETGGWVSGSTVYVLVGSDPSVDIEFALG